MPDLTIDELNLNAIEVNEDDPFAILDIELPPAPDPMDEDRELIDRILRGEDI